MKKIVAISIALMVSASVFANNDANEPATKWLKVGQEPNLVINGLGWFGENGGLFYRLPIREQINIPPTVWRVSKNPSGARVRFKTDSSSLKLKITHGKDNSRLDMWHMSSVGVSGIDLYLGKPGENSFWMTTKAQEQNAEYEHVYFKDKPKQMREFTLYLPSYAELAELKVGVDVDAKVEKPSEYKYKKPVVIYGSSITQGGCAARGSNSFISMIERKINTDTINLGFSGSGKGEEIMAKIISELDASIYVVDCVANMNTKLMDERYEKFVNILRQNKPNIPIVLMTKIHYARELELDEAAEYDRQNKPVFQTYEKLKKQGDKNIYLFDSGALIKAKGDHPSVDGVHLTDLGCSIIADKLAPVLEKILKEKYLCKN